MCAVLRQIAENLRDLCGVLLLPPDLPKCVLTSLVAREAK